jgi:hypothetical protein
MLRTPNLHFHRVQIDFIGGANSKRPRNLGLAELAPPKTENLFACRAGFLHIGRA